MRAAQSAATVGVAQVVEALVPPVAPMPGGGQGLDCPRPTTGTAAPAIAAVVTRKSLRFIDLLLRRRTRQLARLKFPPYQTIHQSCTGA
jgi:hypothetical protein